MTASCLAANIEERVCASVEGRKGIQLNQPRALYVTEGEGKMLWVVDELMTFKASGEDTGGAYALTDSVVPPGGGPPPHIHHREDEAFWVLEGELEVTVGANLAVAGATHIRHAAGSNVAGRQANKGGSYFAHALGGNPASRGSSLQPCDAASVSSPTMRTTTKEAASMVSQVRRLVRSAGEDEVFLTPQSEKAIEKAVQLAALEARQLGHERVDTGHLLLGLARESEAVAARVMAELGVGYEDLLRGVSEAHAADQ